MSSSVKATSVRFDDDSMWVELSDGRTLGVPLAWFPRLLRATPEQRDACRITRAGPALERAGRGHLGDRTC